jgi:hypothetical protein
VALEETLGFGVSLGVLWVIGCSEGVGSLVHILTSWA